MKRKSSKWYRIKYGKREVKKVRLMHRIVCLLPATFTVLESKLGISSRTLWYRLTELLEMGFIRKMLNLYVPIYKVSSERDFFEAVFSRNHGRPLKDITRGYVAKRNGITERDTYVFSTRVTVALNPKLVRKLDGLRGAVPLSLYVEHIIWEYLRARA